MRRSTVSTVLGSVILLLVSATATAQTEQQDSNLSVNLAGSWKLCGGPPPYQCTILKITQVGKKVEAVKVDGDPTGVPLGEVSFKGTFDRNPFTVQWRYASLNFTNPGWMPVNIKVIDANSFTTTIHDAPWKRQPNQ
jgi:hypothetical protein